MSGIFAKLGWRWSLPLIAVALAVLFYIVAILLSWSDYLPFNTYSEGWRMGSLSKVSVRGNPVFKSVEGELLMGNDSSAAVVKEGDQVVFSNPWEFSAGSSELPQIQALTGRTVAIHYRQLWFQLTNVNGDTDYRVVEIKAVNPDAAPRGCGAERSSGATRSDGERVGYITKVSRRGTVLKSDEVIVQLGNAGNQFQAMSILGDEIADCALGFLRSGQRVRVNYRQSLIRNPARRDTTYDIIGIWPAPKTP
ncbi:MAG TPA: hypothetical protein VES73_10150 [Lamprocystis sp. (in: g-proteobacteria)]|nr:hypothetical protein [Lamprocystis sp. (in: g-proteobacteria)]